MYGDMSKGPGTSGTVRTTQVQMISSYRDDHDASYLEIASGDCFWKKDDLVAIIMLTLDS